MILKTDRIILRTPSPNDALDYLTIRNSEFVLTYNAMKKQTLTEAVNSFTEKQTNETSFIIEQQNTGKIIGMIYINEDSLRWGVSSKELSYFLAEAYAHQGFMKESLKAVIAHLFYCQNIEIITTRAFVPNTASRKLLESLGFHQDGVLRRCVKGYGDVIYDDAVYSLFKEEWKRTSE